MGINLRIKHPCPISPLWPLYPQKPLAPDSRIWDRPRLTVNLAGGACGPTQSPSTKDPPTTSHSRGLRLLWVDDLR